MSPGLRRRLGQARRVAIRTLGGSLPGAAAPVVSYDELVELLVPGASDPAVRAAIDAVVAGRPLADPATIRRILGAVEQQLTPSRFSVRLAAGDTAVVGLGDVEVVVDTADASVSALMAGGSYEAHMTAVFAEHVRPGAHVVDVGANLGYFTLLAARLAGPTGRVTACEPNSENVRLLLASLARTSPATRAEVEVLPVGCSDRRGFALFSTHVGSNGGLRPDLGVLDPATVVPTFRLDELVERADLVKIDVEGAEALVVSGATGLLDRSRPIVTTEFSVDMLDRVSATTPEAYLAMFADRGYTIHVVDRAGGPPVPVTADQLLEGWTDRYRIEDLLLLP